MAQRAGPRRVVVLRAAGGAGRPPRPPPPAAWRGGPHPWVPPRARPGSMGIPLPGIRLDVDDGELVADPSSVPTFFLGYVGEEPPPTGPSAMWHTGDRVQRDEQ